MTMIDTVVNRRSIYDLSNDVAIANSEIEDTLALLIKRTPSAFNAQTQRVLLLLDAKHELLWDEAKALLMPLSENKEKTTEKMNSFRKAKGTILFYDDLDTTTSLEEKFPLYAKNFKIWALEQNGMLQMNVWNVLTELGMGASLQHYNEVIEDKVRTLFDVPLSWKLIGQMPFGKIQSVPAEKSVLPIDNRFIVRK